MSKVVELQHKKLIDGELNKIIGKHWKTDVFKRRNLANIVTSSFITALIRKGMLK